MRLSFFLVAVTLLLTACTPEKFGAWLRTQSGSIKEVTQQAKDAAALAKMKIDEAKRVADEAASRAAVLEEGIAKLKVGQDLLKKGLTGSGTSVSSR